MKYTRHGVRVDDDVKQFGPEYNDWELMALEETLDGMVYASATILRYQRAQEGVKSSSTDQIDDNDSIMIMIEARLRELKGKIYDEAGKLDRTSDVLKCVDDIRTKLQSV